MPYSPTTWVDGTTPVDAAHLNPIETELSLLDSRIVPSPTGQDGKWLTVVGGAMVWQAGGVGGGGGLDWEGAWGAGTAYVKGDVVTYNGVVYGAVNDGTGQTPPAASQFPVTNIPISLVTSLPSSPFDGQMVVLTDSLTAPTYTWMLRYNAGSGSAYKWEFIGGAPVEAKVDTSETTASTSPADLATVGPAFTAPRAGDYQAIVWAVATSPSANNYAILGFRFGTVEAGSFATAEGSAGVVQAGISGEQVCTGCGAGDVLKMRYSVTAGTATFSSRRMLVTPRRLA